MVDENPDERDQRRARQRQHERAERVEHVLDDADALFRDHKFPTTSEELAEAYGDQATDLPNETESLGSVFDRLDGAYDSPEAAREAVYGELTGGELSGKRSVDVGAAAEANDERDLREIAEDVENEDAEDR